jgi:deoxyribodipyrimidine photo-lyase
MNRIKSLAELEAHISDIDVSRYAQERNYIDGSTRLSEYITRGCISLPRIQELILSRNSPTSSYKLLNELAWREYWQHTWRIRGEHIFEYIRPLHYNPRQGIPTAVLNADTGIVALDHGIRQLYQTGYIHNHMRLWLAGLICNIARCDWRIGAEWMHSYLVDGDLASNHLSWQWVAGSYTGTPYIPQQENINHYTRTSQSKSYLDYSYEQLMINNIPERLEDISMAVPCHEQRLLADTITLRELQNKDSLHLYSPWTLDSVWRRNETATRVLIVPNESFAQGRVAQTVLDSIHYFSQFIENLEIIHLDAVQISALKSRSIYRKNYPGINFWPGIVEPAELLYPHVDQKFYPSFSAYWKFVNK